MALTTWFTKAVNLLAWYRIDVLLVILLRGEMPHLHLLCDLFSSGPPYKEFLSPVHCSGCLARSLPVIEMIQKNRP